MRINATQVRVINLLLFSILFFLRRPADALYPSVWSEDGILNIPQALSDGWSSLLTPIAGYLLVPSKFITLLSLNLSGIFYPEIAYFLTFITTLGVLVAITSDYVAIKGKEYLPLIIVLLPYDPEVFATPLYIFWWVTLLLLIPLFSANSHFYKESLGLYIITFSSIFLACVSSPLCVLLLPVMMFRVFITRRRLDYLATGFWFIFATIQLSLINRFSSNAGGYSIGFGELKLSIPRYIGNYFYYNGFLSKDGLVVYLLFAVFTGFGLWAIHQAYTSRKLEDFYIGAAFLMTLLAIFSSTVRGSSITDPFTAGPRYFFFPYVFISIFLLTVINKFEKRMVNIIVVVLLISACSLTWLSDFSLFYRIHDHISWRQQMQLCAASPNPYIVKVQASGEYEAAWTRPYTPEECRQVIKSGILTRIYNWQTLPEQRLPD